MKKRDGPLVAFEVFDPPEEVRDPLGEDDFNVAFGVEAPDSAHAVAFSVFVDLADLENNGRVRKDAVLGRVGLETALPRREFAPVCPICEHVGGCWWRDVRGKWH